MTLFVWGQQYAPSAGEGIYLDIDLTFPAHFTTYTLLLDKYGVDIDLTKFASYSTDCLNCDTQIVKDRP